MAKYREYENRIEKLRQQKADLPISLSQEEFGSDSDIDSKEYICDDCGRRLMKMNNEDNEFYCNYCRVSRYPEVEEVRSESKLKTPGGIDGDALVSYPPDPDDLRHKEDNIPGSGIDTLRDKGIRFTSDVYRDGSGRVISRRKWDS